MKTIKTWILTGLFCFFATSESSADFFITINDGSTLPTFVAGQTATISVFGHHNESSPIRLDGFTLGFDLTAAGSPPTQDGVLVPSFFSDFNVTSPLLSGGTLSVFSQGITAGSFANFNLGVEHLNASPLFNLERDTRVKLFDLEFKISASTPAATFGLFFRPDAAFVVDDPFLGPSNIDYNVVAYNEGSQYNHDGETLVAGESNAFQSRFAVSAVPEPSSMVLMALAGGAGAFGAWRKRRKNAACKERATAV